MQLEAPVASLMMPGLLELMPALTVMSVGYLAEVAFVPVFDSKFQAAAAAELVEWMAAAAAGGVAAIVEHVVVPVRH